MIERIFARWLRKKIADRQIQNYSTSNTSFYNLFISWLLGAWFCLGLLISYITYEYGMDSSQCDLCNRIVEIFPTIDVAAKKSDFPNVMRIIWLYMTITTPPVALALIVTSPFIPYDQDPKTSFKKLVMSWLFCASILLIAYVFIFVWGGPVSANSKTKTARIFMHTIYGGYFFSFSAFAMPPLSLWILIYQHINFFSNK
ncbi:MULTISPECIES: hypothetical protein [Methylomonas]|uniref:hypothetical protein n=1 Tax=Methylomonas TaxID=416 RepID=UPI0012329EE0|nr:hypothetical protein [Methylomonas rhizoryzae]